jgi:hypothetical protein
VCRSQAPTGEPRLTCSSMLFTDSMTDSSLGEVCARSRPAPLSIGCLDAGRTSLARLSDLPRLVLHSYHLPVRNRRLSPSSRTSNDRSVACAVDNASRLHDSPRNVQRRTTRPCLSERQRRTLRPRSRGFLHAHHLLHARILRRPASNRPFGRPQTGISYRYDTGPIFTACHQTPMIWRLSRRGRQLQPAA